MCVVLFILIFRSGLNSYLQTTEYSFTHTWNPTPNTPGGHDMLSYVLFMVSNFSWYYCVEATPPFSSPSLSPSRSLALRPSLLNV